MKWGFFMATKGLVTQSPPPGTLRKKPNTETIQSFSPSARELREKSLSLAWPRGQPAVIFSVKTWLTQRPICIERMRRKRRWHTISLPLECNLRLRIWQVADR